MTGDVTRFERNLETNKVNGIAEMVVERVSVHGGHSGQFCSHAVNSLEEIVIAYIHHGFSWVGITEHIPPPNDIVLYPEESREGLTAAKMRKRFSQYMQECRRLQQKFSGEITLYAGMELEAYSGYGEHVDSLLKEFKPDYLVGSVHHVYDIPIDYSKEDYDSAVAKAGGIDGLYCHYFDLQLEMIHRLQPEVIGHFDLVRIFDDSYSVRLSSPEVVQRIERNLEAIRKYGLILDYNLRSLLKGADEPYISRSILLRAKQMGIHVVPGDDSHGVDSIGVNFGRAIEELRNLGFTTDWQRPQLRNYISK